MKLPVLSTLVALALCSSSISAGPQTAAKPAAKSAAKAPAKASPNDELIKLAMAEMSEDILLATVAKTGKEKYDTSADALLRLKAAGISQRVISAILGINVPAPPSPQPAAPPPGPPSVVVNVPSTQHVGVSIDQPSTVSLDGREAGIYVVLQEGALEQLEPAVYAGNASGNKFLHNFVSGLFSVKVEGIVRSPAANLRLQNAIPTFYFFFEVKGAGLSNTGGTFAGYMNSASSPNEFLLVHLNVDKDKRKITVSKDSNWKDSSGVESKSIVDIVFKKVKPGVYEVKPRNPLQPGEYCFLYAAGSADKGGNGKIFDFGVDPGAAVQ